MSRLFATVATIATAALLVAATASAHARPAGAVWGSAVHPQNVYTGHALDSFAGRRPSDSFAGRRPSDSFAGRRPSDSFAGRRPSDSFASRPRDSYANLTLDSYSHANLTLDSYRRAGRARSN